MNSISAASHNSNNSINNNNNNINSNASGSNKHTITELNTNSMNNSNHTRILDSILSNFVNNKEVAYDPEKNRWVALSNVTKKLERQGSVCDTLSWDPKRELVWNLNAYKDIYVIQFDPKTLELSEDPAK